MGAKEQVDVVGRGLARSRAYSFLSALFLYPGEETLSRLNWEEAEEALALLDPSDGLKEAFASLRRGLQGAAALQSEYVGIFGHTLSEECSPYETQYDSAQIFRQTQTLADVAGFYGAFGLEVSDQAKERLDHISIELEFMAFLTYKVGYASVSGGSDKAEICREAQRKFLNDHLGRWGPAFSRRLETRAQEGFYQRLARLTERFLTFELESLGVNPQQVEGAARFPFEPEGGCFSCGTRDLCVPEEGSS